MPDAIQKLDNNRNQYEDTKLVYFSTRPSGYDVKHNNPQQFDTSPFAGRLAIRFDDPTYYWGE